MGWEASAFVPSGLEKRLHEINILPKLRVGNTVINTF